MISEQNSTKPFYRILCWDFVASGFWSHISFDQTSSTRSRLRIIVLVISACSEIQFQIPLHCIVIVAIFNLSTVLFEFFMKGDQREFNPDWFPTDQPTLNPTEQPTVQPISLFLLPAIIRIASKRSSRGFIMEINSIFKPWQSHNQKWICDTTVIISIIVIFVDSSVTMPPGDSGSSSSVPVSISLIRQSHCEFLWTIFHNFERRLHFRVLRNNGTALCVSCVQKRKISQKASWSRFQKKSSHLSWVSPSMDQTLPSWLQPESRPFLVDDNPLDDIRERSNIT